MNKEQYLDLKKALIKAGYLEEISEIETMGPPKDALDFFKKYSFVVVNSGMKNQVAKNTWEKIIKALDKKRPVSSVFGHSAKSEAIQKAWENRQELFQEYLSQPRNKLLDWLEKLSWIGPTTKYHLAGILEWMSVNLAAILYASQANIERRRKVFAPNWPKRPGTGSGRLIQLYGGRQTWG